MNSHRSSPESDETPTLSRREVLTACGIGTGIAATIVGVGWYVGEEIGDIGRTVSATVIERESPLGIRYLDSVTARFDDDGIPGGPVSLSLTLTDQMIRRPLERIDIYTYDGTKLATNSPEGTQVYLSRLGEANLPIEYILAFRLPDGAGEKTRLAELVRIRIGTSEQETQKR